MNDNRNNNRELINRINILRVDLLTLKRELVKVKELYFGIIIVNKTENEFQEEINIMNENIKNHIEDMINNDFPNFSLFEGITNLNITNLITIIEDELDILTGHRRWSYEISKKIQKNLNDSISSLQRIHIFHILNPETLIKYIHQFIKSQIGNTRKGYLENILLLNA